MTHHNPVVSLDGFPFYIDNLQPPINVVLLNIRTDTEMFSEPIKILSLVLRSQSK